MAALSQPLDLPHVFGAPMSAIRSDDECDESALLLAAKITLNEIKMLQSRSKGKARDDAPPNDSEFALSLSHSLTHAEIQRIQDHKLAVSLGKAHDLDDEALDAFLEDRLRAQRDRDAGTKVSPDPSMGSSGSRSPSVASEISSHGTCFGSVLVS